MASGPGRVLCPVSRVHSNNLPGETLAGPCAVHRGSLVPPVRKDPLRCSAVAMVVSPEQRIQRSCLGPCGPPIKIIIRKITGFLPRLPKYVALRPLKTKIEFYNGSRIQAFPNSPETIRGEPGVNLLFADEFSYIKNDKELYEAAVFSLATTNGRFLATSTPGSRESMFYAMCTDDVNYGDVSRHHVSYLDALEPKGPLKLEILEKLRRQFSSDPWRWRREMEAEFADDQDSWLSMALITRCVDPKLEYIREGAILTGSGPVDT